MKMVKTAELRVWRSVLLRSCVANEIRLELRLSNGFKFKLTAMVLPFVERETSVSVTSTQPTIGQEQERKKFDTKTISK